MAKKSDFDSIAERLLAEIEQDGDRIHARLFGDDPGPDAKRLSRDDFSIHVAKNWDAPPYPEWRQDLLDRFAPKDPQTGIRPEWGLKSFSRVLQDAFPMGRPPDPAPPPH